MRQLLIISVFVYILIMIKIRKDHSSFCEAWEYSMFGPMLIIGIMVGTTMFFLSYPAMECESTAVDNLVVCGRTLYRVDEVKTSNKYSEFELKNLSDAEQVFYQIQVREGIYDIKNNAANYKSKHQKWDS